MRNQEKTTIRKVGFHKSESIYLIIRGLEVGIASGLVCVLYRFALEYAEKGLMQALDFVKGNPARIALWLLLLCALGVMVSYINEWEPDAAGSGIPQTSGEIRGYFSLNQGSSASTSLRLPHTRRLQRCTSIRRDRPRSLTQPTIN